MLYHGTDFSENGAARGGAQGKMRNSPAAAWLSKIEGARSTRDLVGILRDYLDALPAEEASQLPRGCTAENVSTAAEIHEWAVTLAREDLKGDGTDHSALHQAAAVFTAAGARLPKMGDQPKG
jgi:hypothetical protein